MMKGCEGIRGGGCKEHPHDKQTPGVCSSCLREKLSQLYNTNPIIIHPPSFSPNTPSSPYSPQTQPFSSSATTDSSSSRGSSSHHRRRFRRNASHAAESASCMVTLNLKKSKSLAFASRNRIRERDVSTRKKDGFWAKVLKLKKRDTREPLVTA